MTLTAGKTIGTRDNWIKFDSVPHIRRRSVNGSSISQVAAGGDSTKAGWGLIFVPGMRIGS
jgi:hypothetical protein